MRIFFSLFLFLFFGSNLANLLETIVLQLGDLCCLVHNGYGAYEPHNKQWVKDRVFAHLKRMAT
jgi:hypothetical protein